MRHLLLRLEGPILSFGDVAIDDALRTARFPSLSMVCGLLANAAGMCRTNPAEIQELQKKMEIASRLDRPGTRMTDYQTALIHAKDVVWTSAGKVSGRDGGESGEMTVQLRKEYLADASVTVAVAMPDEWIDRYRQALDAPARPLFLGRRSCPPSRPIYLGIIEATDVLAALELCPMDSGRAVTVEAQWPARLGSSRKSRATISSDLKDWRNRMHVGIRQVREGSITVGAVT